jgi:hypothetical protein
VQIPAYRDAELSATLLDLYAKADSPSLLRVSVVWQHGPREKLSPSLRRLPCLEILDVPHHESRGCNWARSLLQTNWGNEPFTLLLDSHHRFVSGWDGTLIKMYQDLLRRSSEKPIITAYLPSYNPDQDPRGRKRRPYKIYPYARESGLLTRLTSFPIPGYKALTKPVAADFASLHFLFAAGWFNREIPFDPRIYFFGDEVLMSLRAYTHGYDLFHPHMVLGWHSFDRTTRVPHWIDHSDWRKRHDRSLAIMRKIFKGEDSGSFGTGKQRSVAEYENHILLELAEEPRNEASCIS